MKSDYFVEFVYFDQALKQQEQYKFLIEKYKRNMEGIGLMKAEKIKEVESILNVIELLNEDVKKFAKLIPKPLGSSETKVETPKIKSKKTKKSQKKTNKKTEIKTKKPVKGGLKDLKLGLEKIRDELGRM